MKMVLLCILLVACGVEDVEPGHLYACEGVFTCYGDHFGLTRSEGCASSLEEAKYLYTEAALEITQQAKCGDDWMIEVTCQRLEKRCVYESSLETSRN